MKIERRLCEESDLDFVFDLKVKTMKKYIEHYYGWDEEDQKKRTFQEMKEKYGSMRIILVDGIEVGVTTFENGDECHIGLTMIEPEYQNKGIATMFIKEYIEIAKLENKRIHIMTNVINPAQELYKKLGFKVYNQDDVRVYLEIKNHTKHPEI